jgi:hypothetical protein
MFQKPSSGEERETPTLFYSAGSLSSPEDGNRYSSQNIMFSSYLELQTVEKSRNPKIPKYVLETKLFDLKV